MSERSDTFKLGRVELTYFDVVALIDDLRKENANLTARIAELEEAQRWIPVGERLPEAQIIYDEFDAIVEFETIEGRVEKVARLLFWDCRDKTWNEDICDEGFVNVTGCVTHWRERPTLPEVYGKEREE